MLPSGAAGICLCSVVHASLHSALGTCVGSIREPWLQPSWLIHSQSLQNHQPPLPLPRGPRSVRGYSHGTLLVHYWFQTASASNNTVRKTYWKLSVRKTRHLRKCARTRCGNLMCRRPWHHAVASRWLR